MSFVKTGAGRIVSEIKQEVKNGKKVTSSRDIPTKPVKKGK